MRGPQIAVPRNQNDGYWEYPMMLLLVQYMSFEFLCCLVQNGHTVDSNIIIYCKKGPMMVCDEE